MVKVVHGIHTERIKYFAKFILEGLVLTQLKTYSSQLLTAPVAMIKTWGSLHVKRTKPLFDALQKADVDNKAKLVKAMKENPKFLLKPYLNWLDEEYHPEVSELWPKLVL